MKASQFQYLNKEEVPERTDQPSLEAQMHPVLSGGNYALIGNGKPEFPAEAPVGSLGQELKQKGFKHEPTDGHYGQVESSWIVHGPSREQAMELGRRHGQEAIVYSDSGQPELIYVNGPNAGKYHPSATSVQQYFRARPKDNFTKIPGHGFVRLNFDFDKLLDVPKKSLAPEGDNMDSKAEKNMVTVTDLKKSLADMLKRQIEAYQSKLVDLRDRELNKGEGELVAGMDATAGDFSFGVCPLCNSEACECVDLAKTATFGAVPEWRKLAEEENKKDGKKENCKGCGKLKKMCKCGEITKKSEVEVDNCLLCGQPQFNCECVSKLQKNTKIDEAKKIGSRTATQRKKDNAKEDRFKAAHGVKPAELHAEQQARGEHAAKVVANKQAKKSEYFYDEKHGSETVKEGQSQAGEPRLKEVGTHAGILPSDAPVKDAGGLDDGSGGEPASKEDKKGKKGKKLKKEELEKAGFDRAGAPRNPVSAAAGSFGAAAGLKPKAPAFAKPAKTPVARVHPDAGQKKVVLGAAPGAKPGTVAARMQVGSGGVGKAPAPSFGQRIANIFSGGAKLANSEDIDNDLQKAEEFGNCVLCGQPEHNGNCV